MIGRFTVIITLILSMTCQVVGQETRILRGKVTDGGKEVLIGASIFEYGNMQNHVLSNMDGEFELYFSKKKMVVLEISYACSWNPFLYEIAPDDEFVNIDIYYKKAIRNTKRIQRKLKRKNRTSTK